MAPVPSTTGTVRSSTDATFDAAGTAVTFAFDAGTDNDRFLIVSVTFDGPSAHTLGDTAVTYNGVALTPFGATSVVNNCKKRTYGLVAPATGSNTVSVDPSGGIGSEDAVIEVYCYSGVNQSSPYDGYTIAQATDNVNPYESPLTITSAVGDLVWVSHGGRGSSVSGGTATGFTERLDNVAGASNIAAVSGDATGAASVVTSVAWAGLIALDYCVHGINLNANTATAAVTGTLASGTKTQANLVSGDDGLGNPITIVLTLTGDTWVASGATFDAIRDDIIAGLDAASSPATGWNTLVRDALAVTAVVRTSATVVTITIPAVPTYLISADEVITCTIPAAAVSLAAEIVGSPTITIHYGVRLSAYSGTTNASGVKTTDLTSDQASVRTLTTAYVNGAVVARTTTFPA